MHRSCIVQDLGRMSYGEALAVQHQIADARKLGMGTDHLLFVEHPHVVTIGRNGHESNLLASDEVFRRSGIDVQRSDRGGDVTYHGPGQIVAYPIMDLRLWKRDVGEFVRSVEQVLIDTLFEFGIVGTRIPKLTGVWVVTDGVAAKVAAIGVHLSRWVSTHGWALNVSTDLKYFQYIVPCGLQKPVTSMAELGIVADAADVKSSLAKHFAQIFDFDLQFEPAPALMGDF